MLTHLALINPSRSNPAHRSVWRIQRLLCTWASHLFGADAPIMTCITKLMCCTLYVCIRVHPLPMDEQSLRKHHDKELKEWIERQYILRSVLVILSSDTNDMHSTTVSVTKSWSDTRISPPRVVLCCVEYLCYHFRFIYQACVSSYP